MNIGDSAVICLEDGLFLAFWFAGISGPARGGLPICTNLGLWFHTYMGDTGGRGFLLDLSSVLMSLFPHSGFLSFL